jgi:hypothetical protein
MIARMRLSVLFQFTFVMLPYVINFVSDPAFLTQM